MNTSIDVVALAKDKLTSRATRSKFRDAIIARRLRCAMIGGTCVRRDVDTNYCGTLAEANIKAVEMLRKVTLSGILLSAFLAVTAVAILAQGGSTDTSKPTPVTGPAKH